MLEVREGFRSEELLPQTTGRRWKKIFFQNSHGGEGEMEGRGGEEGGEGGGSGRSGRFLWKGSKGMGPGAS